MNVTALANINIGQKLHLHYYFMFTFYFKLMNRVSLTQKQRPTTQVKTTTGKPEDYDD